MKHYNTDDIVTLTDLANVMVSIICILSQHLKAHTCMLEIQIITVVHTVHTYTTDTHTVEANY